MTWSHLGHKNKLITFLINVRICQEQARKSLKWKMWLDNAFKMRELIIWVWYIYIIFEYRCAMSVTKSVTGATHLNISAKWSQIFTKTSANVNIGLGSRLKLFAGACVQLNRHSSAQYGRIFTKIGTITNRYQGWTKKNLGTLRARTRARHA